MRIDLATKVLSRSRMARWWNSPSAWADDCLGIDLASYQREVLDALPHRRRVALRGPHGLGKTMQGSILVLWFSTTRDLAGKDWKVITTASVWRHLEVYLWPEIHKWAGRIDFATLGRAPLRSGVELMDRNLKMRHGAATPVASNQPERIEGAHADELLYLLDEAKMIEPATWDSIEGAFSNAGEDVSANAYAFAMSTPGPPSGRFYEIHKRAPGYEDWWVRHVTLQEAIAAGRISSSWAEQRALQWGADSAIYHNRVLGEFHASDEDSVIPLAWLEAAIERWHAWERAGRPDQGGPYWTGVDVGRGGDESILALRDGPVIRELRGSRSRDTMSVVGQVQGLDGRAIVDVIGVGAGVYDRLREVDARPLAYAGSGKTLRRDRSGKFGFVNCLTGEAPVKPIGDLLRIYRSRYEGPLFKIKTARGDEFAATANHQVMTLRGWVSVQSLHVGDQLCDALGPDATLPIAGGHPQEHDVPPVLSEIYGAADRLFGSERVTCRAVNFHGDVPMSDVDIVTINRDLLPTDDMSGQAAEDLALIGPLLRHGALARKGDLSLTLRVSDGDTRVAATLPHHGMARGLNSPLLDRHAVTMEVVREESVSQLDTSVSKDVSDQVVADAHGLGESEYRLTGKVAPLYLRSVESKGSAQLDVLGLRSQFDSGVPEDAPDDVLVDGKDQSETVDRLSRGVAKNDLRLIDRPGYGESHSFSAASYLNTVLAQDLMEGLPVSPEVLRERLESFPGRIPLNEVIGIELTTPAAHDAPWVYTLETSTGSYMTNHTAHRNCRSAAYWNLREALDPEFEPTIALPPDELMISDLTTPRWDIVSGAPPKYRIETKEKVVERLGRSPDRGDSVAMGFWAEHHRPGQADSWAAPVGHMPTSAMNPFAGR